MVNNGSSNETTWMYLRTSVCTVKSVDTGTVYSWVVATGVGNPLPACFPELLSHIRSAIIMIPLLAGKALYHFTLSMWLPAQTIYRLVASSSLGQLCVGDKVASFSPDSITGSAATSASDCIVFDESLGGRKHSAVLCCSQWQRMHNQHSTLQLHINEPKFKALL